MTEAPTQDERIERVARAIKHTALISDHWGGADFNGFSDEDGLVLAKAALAALDSTPGVEAALVDVIEDKEALAVAFDAGFVIDKREDVECVTNAKTMKAALNLLLQHRRRNLPW